MKSLRPQSTSIRPSRSERPGLPRMLATLIADPGWFIVQIVMAIAEGITRAIINRRQKHKHKPSSKADKEGEG